MAEKRTSPRSFSWHVSAGMPALGELAGVPYHLLFYDFDAIVAAYRKGVAKLREMFPPQVEVCLPGWSPISYGHVNTLGCDLIFPENSEVAHRPAFDTLDAGIEALGREVDFARSGRFPFYSELHARLRREFRGESDVPFVGFEAEGPITTAWALRGHEFFTDIYDEPDKVRVFLGRITDSIVAYKKLLASMNERPALSPQNALLAENAQDAHIADDIAAMIPPALWPELVVPSLERFYRGSNGARRLLHLENLSVAHLAYLDELRIDLFDPSVSPKLSARSITDNCRTPFLWHLNTMQLRDMTEAEISAWVADSAAGGAEGVFAIIDRVDCHPRGAAKIEAFIHAAQEVERLMQEETPLKKAATESRV